MEYEITSQDVTVKDYPAPRASTESSKFEETTIILGIQESLGAYLLSRDLLRALFEIDLSSVYPHFEPKSGISLIEEFYEKPVPEEMLEYDIIVRIPPKKRYTIELEIKSIKRAKPKIVKPESL